MTSLPHENFVKTLLLLQAPRTSPPGADVVEQKRAVQLILQPILCHASQCLRLGRLLTTAAPEKPMATAVLVSSKCKTTLPLNSVQLGFACTASAPACPSSKP